LDADLSRRRQRVEAQAANILTWRYPESIGMGILGGWDGNEVGILFVLATPYVEENLRGGSDGTGESYVEVERIGPIEIQEEQRNGEDDAG